MVYSTFIKEYNIDLLKENISFKKYQTLLNNISSKSDLAQRIYLRMTPDHEIKDKNMLKYKRSIELNKEDQDSLKMFATLIGGPK